MKKITHTFVLLALFISMGINAFAQTSSWTPLVSGTSNALVGVSVISKDTCYTAGANGTVLKTVNGGTTWTSQTTPTSQTLYGVDFIDANTGVAAGDNGAIIRTTNGGTTWTSVITTSESYRSVRFINSTTGFITGGNGTILRTTNGGATWLPTSTGVSVAIYAVYFSSPTIGFASCFSGEILKTTDGGSTWNTSSTGVSTQLNTIIFTSSTTGVVVGASGVIRKTTDGGTTWTTVVMTSTSDFLQGQVFVNSNTGFITGGNIGANTGIILTTTDGGTTWTTYLPGTARLCNVDFANANTGYAVGLGGTILKYTSNVGISENATSTVSLSAFPNPSSTLATIDISSLNLNETVYIQIYDVTGKLVRTIENENKTMLQIEKDELNSGIYLINVNTKDKLVGTAKIVFE